MLKTVPVAALAMANGVLSATVYSGERKSKAHHVQKDIAVTGGLVAGAAATAWMANALASTDSSDSSGFKEVLCPAWRPRPDGKPNDVVFSDNELPDPEVFKRCTTINGSLEVLNSAEPFNFKLEDIFPNLKKVNGNVRFYGYESSPMLSNASYNLISLQQIGGYFTVTDINFTHAVDKFLSMPNLRSVGGHVRFYALDFLESGFHFNRLETVGTNPDFIMNNYMLFGKVSGGNYDKQDVGIQHFGFQSLHSVLGAIGTNGGNVLLKKGVPVKFPNLQFVGACDDLNFFEVSDDFSNTSSQVVVPVEFSQEEFSSGSLISTACACTGPTAFGCSQCIGEKVVGAGCPFPAAR